MIPTTRRPSMATQARGALEALAGRAETGDEHAALEALAALGHTYRGRPGPHRAAASLKFVTALVLASMVLAVDRPSRDFQITARPDTASRATKA